MAYLFNFFNFKASKMEIRMDLSDIELHIDVQEKNMYEEKLTRYFELD